MIESAKPQTTLATVLDPQWIAGRGRLAQSIKLEEEGTNRLVVIAILTIVATIVILLFWASLTEVGEIASASGEIIPLGSVKKIQHLEGGIISAIHVHEGDKVEKDQVLMELESGAAAAELKQQQAHLATLEFQESQLRSFIGGKINKNTHGKTRHKTTPLQGKHLQFAHLAATQNDLLHSKRQALEAQITVLHSQVQENRAGYDLAAAQAKKVREQIAIVSEQIRSRQNLVKEGYVARTVLLDQKRDLARTQTQLAELEGQMKRSREIIVGIEARMAELHARIRLDATQEISKVRSEIAELREAIERASDRVKRLIIRSPVRGIVKGPLIETIGGVVAPGAVLLEVIPIDAPLIVEARVLPKDIGFVHTSQSALVKVATYDYTRFGSIDGTIETTSATTFQDEKGNPFYRVRIRLAKNYVGNDPKRNLIIPGMTIMADIKTGEKTVLAYLLKPIVRATDEAMHER